MRKSRFACLTVICFCVAALVAQEKAGGNSRVSSTPQWEKIKSLVGEWEGYTEQAGKKIPARITVRMTGDGSALMHWMGPGTAHEMVTMFHMDLEELLATHYCSAHNQPRFHALPERQSDRIEFEFKDGTNIRPGDGHMRQLAIIFVDADHHNETWGYDSNGKIQSATFTMTRVKRPAKK